MDIKAYFLHRGSLQKHFEVLGGKKPQTIVTHCDFCKFDGLYFKKALLGIK